MNQEQINRDLSENDSTSSVFQQKVVEACRKWAKHSCDSMQRLHSSWDVNAYIYRGYRIVDKDDLDAIKDKEPPKIIVPITYAQTQTLLSYLFSVFTQRKYLYELQGFGPEDVKGAMALTEDLSYQMTKSKMFFVLYNWLLDAAKTGFGVVRCDWKEEYVRMRTSRQQPAGGFMSMMSSMFGRQPQMETVEQVEEALCFQGNQVSNVSPYAFYPDPGVSIANFQNGQFVMHEEEISSSVLRGLEGDVYFGVEKIPNEMHKDLFTERYRRVQGPFGNTEKTDRNNLVGKHKEQNTVIKSEFEVTLSEKQASKLFDVNLGDDPKPVKWLITLGNDQKVIRFEPSGYFHGRYNYAVVEYSPDHDAFYNPGLSETVAELQNIVTFFLNSHVANVRKIIANRFIVDPSKVEMEDIKSGSLFIRMKGVAGADINRAIQQLNVSDITRSHMTDMQVLSALIQLVTGINDNALGQYSTGRRSATEARSVNAGASARLRMHASLAWMQGIEPLGRQIISNTRQWRDQEIYEQIVGARALEAPYEAVILADPMKLAGGYDFVPYDATLPSDRQFQAGVLKELFELLVSNPDSMQLLNKDPLKLLNHIADLLGINNLQDFNLSQLPQPAVPQAQVVSDAQAADAAAGGAQPVDIGGEDVLRQLAS